MLIYFIYIVIIIIKIIITIIIVWYYIIIIIVVVVIVVFDNILSEIALIYHISSFIHFDIQQKIFQISYIYSS